MPTQPTSIAFVPPGSLRVTTDLLLAFALMLLGAMVVLGWLLHVPMMVEIKTGLVPMVFNTGLCFFLSGAAIAAVKLPPQMARTARGVIALALVLLCGASLIEFMVDRSFGIDLAFLHEWYNYGNTRPGRMAPNTALGFIAIGAVLWLSDRVTSHPRAIGVVLLTFAVLAIGLTGLVGYMLAPDLLFGWARSARMALHTASGMIVAGIALWLAWSRSSWYLSRVYFREDEKIRFLGAAILGVVTLTVGLVGFVLLQNSLEYALENDLQTVVRNRGPWFHLAVEQLDRRVHTAVRLSGLDTAARARLDGDGVALQQTFAQRATRLLDDGFQGIALRRSTGLIVQRIGTINDTVPLRAALDQDRTELLWDGVMLLRSHLAVIGADGVPAELLIDQPVEQLEQTLFNAKRIGSTGEIGACVGNGATLLCFPGSAHRAPFPIPRKSSVGTPLAAEFAVRGETGVIHSVDYRNVNVVAAYGPLAPGFGFVAKQDTVELYAVIRHALGIGTPIILLIAGLGVALLYSQLKPLATGLWASELAASEKEIQMRAIMDAAADGILTTDRHGTIQAINPAAGRIFGYAPDDLKGRAIAQLMPPERHFAHTRAMMRLLRQRTPRFDGVHGIELIGQRRDGSRFPLELTIKEVALTGQRLFVGVLRDISDRKDAEQRLTEQAQFDSLTGLPNRWLFMDRLSTALLRAERAGGAVALMFLDLDGFKAVNDTLGHQAGDELLIQVARRLTAQVRKSDTVARLAGDEFTVVLEKLNDAERDTRAIADKLIAATQTEFLVAGQTVRVTASIGIAIQHGNAAPVAVDALLRTADQQMYAAKHAGKNRYQIAAD